jgi:glycosyltransferase involved in cell wall biosynthesis
VADPVSLTHRILARSRSGAPMKASLIIPALNEAAVIGDVVASVPAGLVVEIVVVDNGSTDGTGEVAARAGARVVREPRRGYGAACAAGVGAVAADTEVAAFLDGDGSQDPRELPRLLGPIERGEADFVLGARPIGRHHPLHASLGSGLVARLVSLRYGVRVTDIGPFRALRVALLRRLGMRDLAFGWPAEMVVKAAALGARIVEVPVSQGPRRGGRSKVSGTLTGSLRAGYGFLAAALRAARDVP